jgi:hypothetical protein
MKCDVCGITRAFDLGYPAEISIAFVTCEYCDKVLCGQCVFDHEREHRKPNESPDAEGRG